MARNLTFTVRSSLLALIISHTVAVLAPPRFRTFGRHHTAITYYRQLAEAMTADILSDFWILAFTQQRWRAYELGLRCGTSLGRIYLKRRPMSR